MGRTPYLVVETRLLSDGMIRRNNYDRSMKSVVSEKGQVTIPKRLRDRLGLRTGEVIDFEEEGGLLVGRKVANQDPVDLLYGILQSSESSDELLAALRGASPE